MGGGYELNASFADGSGGGSFEFGTDFVDDNDFGHVVFDGLDHNGVLEGGGGDLKTSSTTDGGVGDVAIACNFVGCVYDHDAFAHVVRQDSGDLAEHCGLANTRPTKEQNALAGPDQVFNYGDGAVYGPTYTAGETYDLALAVPEG